MENMYAPPLAAVTDAPRVAERREFFVVAPAKFVLLYLGTFGLYFYYWAYMHWARHRRFTGEPMWPVARAIFSVFFAHSLNDAIDRRAAPLGHRWSPGTWATLYVITTIGAVLADRLAANDIGLPYTTLVAILLTLPAAYACLRTQRAANVACGDPAGSANRRLTWANYLWLAFGLLVWALAAFGLYAEFLESVT